MRFQSLWQMPLLLGVAATSLTYAAAPAAVAVAPAAPVVAAAPAASGPVDTATLLKQIEDLKKQVSHIAYKQRKADEKLESSTKVEDAKIGILQANQVSAYPAGYIAIPGTNSAIKIGGRIKADGTYYAGNASDVSGGALTVKSLPIQNVATAGSRSGHTNATMQASRFEINSLTRTNKGDIKAQLQTDFYGANASAVGGSSGTSTAYGLRVRQANVVWNNLLVGQTETNFHDTDLMGAALDNNGGVTTATRRPQIRWTQKICDGLSLAVSAEKGNTDYMSQGAATADNSNSGKSSIPDFTARLRYEGKQGFVSLRSALRKLQVNVAAGDTITTSGNPSTSTVSTQDFRSNQTGWGLGVSGKLITTGKSSLYSQINFGDGLGYLVDDASNQAAYLQVPTAATATTAPTAVMLSRYAARFDTNTVTNGVLGYEHWWTEEFRTNIAGSYTKIKNSRFAPVLSGTSQINARIKKVLVNAIYSPVKSIDIGIEFMHGMRETMAGAVDVAAGTAPTSLYAGGTGKATQVMTSFIYKF